MLVALAAFRYSRVCLDGSSTRQARDRGAERRLCRKGGAALRASAQPQRRVSGDDGLVAATDREAVTYARPRLGPLVLRPRFSAGRFWADIGTPRQFGGSADSGPRSRKVSCRAAALRCCAASRLWRSSRFTTTISEPALKSSRRRSRGRRGRSRSTPARMVQSLSARSWKRTPTPSPMTRRPASMATWSRRASSTRQKSYGSPCRARPRSRAC
jgi:hypothetical protein